MNATDQVTRTNDFNHIVLGRRSIKIYDPTVKISHEEMSEMLGKATRAPSSINLQPWRFLVIESKKAKATLLDLAQSNSHQVVTSAAVIAIFGDLEHDTYAEDIFNTEVELGYMPDDVKKQMLSFTKDIYSTVPDTYRKDVALIDGGLVAMQLMLVARAHGYDTNPIGGYDKERIAEAFGMDKGRYVPIMLVSIGKAVNDGYPSMRLPVDRVAEWK
jgi:nitroreductase